MSEEKKCDQAPEPRETRVSSEVNHKIPRPNVRLISTRSELHPRLRRVGPQQPRAR